MNEEKKPTAAERIAAAEERRQKKVTAEDKAREAQFADDLEAIEKLEDELGVRLRYSSQVKNFVPGLPVVVGVRSPDGGEYKRFQSKMNRQGITGDGKVAALIELAQMCWKYPADKDARDGMVEANTGLLASVGQFVNSLAEVEIKEEGKG